MQRTPITLGGLLLFFAEMSMMSQLYRSNKHIVCFVDGTQRHRGVSRFIPEQYKQIPLLSLLPFMLGVDGYIRTESMESLKEYATVFSGGNCMIWPKQLQHATLIHDQYAYDSTLSLQMTFLEHGYVPELVMKPIVMAWAQDFLRQKATRKFPIVLHLKNSQVATSKNNANRQEWRKFLVYAGRYTGVVFVLIGNESVDGDIRTLPNVIMAQDFGCSLAQELSLVLAAGAFMGMSSGPSSMAIFSKTPYLIFHDPEHGHGTIIREIGDLDSFSFAKPGQRFLRRDDVAETIIDGFEWLLPYAYGQYNLHT